MKLPIKRTLTIAVAFLAGWIGAWLLCRGYSYRVDRWTGEVGRSWEKKNERWFFGENKDHVFHTKERCEGWREAQIEEISNLLSDPIPPEQNTAAMKLAMSYVEKALQDALKDDACWKEQKAAEKVSRPATFEEYLAKRKGK